MANTVSLSVTVNPDETAKITDTTSYLDPIRADVGVFLKVFKVNYLSEKTELEGTLDDVDPFSTTEVYFDLPQDGWYTVYYVAIPKYSVDTTYAEGDAVIDENTFTVYKSLDDNNTGNALGNTSFWEEVEDPAALALNKDTVDESENIDSLVYNTVIIDKLGDYFQDRAVEAAQEGASVLKEPTETIWLFSIADFSIQAALVAQSRQQYAAAERYIRRVDELVRP